MLKAMCTSFVPGFRSAASGIVTFADLPSKWYPEPGNAGSPAPPSSTLVSFPSWLPVASTMVVPLVSSMCQVSNVWVPAASAVAGKAIVSPARRARTSPRRPDRWLSKTGVRTTTAPPTCPSTRGCPSGGGRADSLLPDRVLLGHHNGTTQALPSAVVVGVDTPFAGSRPGEDDLACPHAMSSRSARVGGGYLGVLVSPRSCL